MRSAKRLLLPAASLALLLGWQSVPVRGETIVYSFTDQSGVTHFTNMPNDPRFRPVSTRKAPRTFAEPRSRPYEEAILKTAGKYGVDANLLRAVIKCESNFNHLAVSRAGAQGLMQLMPETARLNNVVNPFNARENLEGGTQYFKYLLDSFGSTTLALAAYNAGEGVVRRHGGIPPFKETRNYVKAVLSQYDSYRSNGIGDAAVSSSDIQSFVNSEGVSLFTNLPWKYRRTADWRRMGEQ